MIIKNSLRIKQLEQQIAILEQEVIARDKVILRMKLQNKKLRLDNKLLKEKQNEKLTLLPNTGPFLELFKCNNRHG